MTISVIIPAYNAGMFIERAIRSAAVQTLRPAEILVIDDLSTDNTVLVVAELQRHIQGLRLFRTQQNNGPAAARNLGLREARSDWIALLDADDAWKPDRLEALHSLAEGEGLDAVADNQVFWDLDANMPLRLAFQPVAPKTTVTVRSLFENDNDFNFSRFNWALLKPLIRRQFLIENKIEYDERLRSGEDSVFYTEMLFHGAKWELIGDAYYLYSVSRNRTGKTSNTRSQHNFQRLAESCDRIVDRYRDNIDGDLLRLIRSRKRTMLLIHKANEARGIRRSGNYARYTAYLAKNPALTARLAVRLLHNMLHKDVSAVTQ